MSTQGSMGGGTTDGASGHIGPRTLCIRWCVRPCLPRSGQPTGNDLVLMGKQERKKLSLRDATSSKLPRVRLFLEGRPPRLVLGARRGPGERQGLPRKGGEVRVPLGPNRSLAK